MADPIYPQQNTPYTYLVGWSKLDKWYYGVRFANNNEPANDLWIVYHTSSKYVKELRRNHGEPDVIEVRRVFDSKVKAARWEDAVLRRMKVTHTERWINKNVAGSFTITGGISPMKGRKHTTDQNNKKSARQKGVRFTLEHKLKIGIANHGKKHTSEQIEAQKIRQRGRKLKPRTKTHRTNNAKANSLWWQVTNSIGVIKVVLGLRSYCKEHNLNHSNLSNRGFSKGHFATKLPTPTCVTKNPLPSVNSCLMPHPITPSEVLASEAF